MVLVGRRGKGVVLESTISNVFCWKTLFRGLRRGETYKIRKERKWNVMFLRPFCYRICYHTCRQGTAPFLSRLNNGNDWMTLPLPSPLQFKFAHNLVSGILR